MFSTRAGLLLDHLPTSSPRCGEADGAELLLLDKQ